MANRELHMKNKLISILASLVLMLFPQISLSAEGSDNENEGEENKSNEERVIISFNIDLR